MPSLGVGGAVMPILHLSQIAAALGLPAPAGLERARLIHPREVAEFLG